MTVRNLARRAVGGSLSLAALAPRLFAGPLPTNDRGVPLDATTHVLLGLLERSGRPSLDEVGPERARQEMRRQGWIGAMRPEALHRVEDRWIDAPTTEIPMPGPQPP